MVKLSSVATAPQMLESPPGNKGAPPRQVPSTGILPAKEATAAIQKRLAVPNQSSYAPLNRTVEVKLPPKSGMLPKLTSLASMPFAPAKKNTGLRGAELPAAPAPDPAPAPVSSWKTAVRKFSFFKPKVSAPAPAAASEPKAPLPLAAEKPPVTLPGWKHLEEGELQSLETYARTQGPDGRAVPKKDPVRPPPLPKRDVPSSMAAPAAAPAPTEPAAPVTVPPLLADIPHVAVEKHRLPRPLHEPKKHPEPQKQESFAPLPKAPPSSAGGPSVSSAIKVGVPLSEAGAVARTETVTPPVRAKVLPPPLPFVAPRQEAPVLSPPAARVEDMSPGPVTVGKPAFPETLVEKNSPPLVKTPPAAAIPMADPLPAVVAPPPRASNQPLAPTRSLPGAEAFRPRPIPEAPSREKVIVVPRSDAPAPKPPPVVGPRLKPPALPRANKPPPEAEKIAPLSEPVETVAVAEPAVPVAAPSASVAEMKSSEPPAADLVAESKSEPPATVPLEAVVPIVAAGAVAIAEARSSEAVAETKKMPVVEKKTEVAPAAKLPPAGMPLVRPVPSTAVPAPAKGKTADPGRGKKNLAVPATIPAAGTGTPTPEKTPATRSARTKKRRLIGAILFYLFFLGGVLPALYLLGIHFGSETRVEGQVIPPSGTTVNDEIWIVTDFRPLALSVADDLANDRTPKLQEIQERQDHVQRAQADIAAREERIRLLQEQIQATKDSIASVVQQARDAAQKMWDGPGAQLGAEYNARLTQLQEAIAARAKSLNLKYAPDDSYRSPDVWANAYRLALYQTPPGVDGVKEHLWIEDQLKQWRDYTKTVDARQAQIRQQAAQIQLSPTAQVTTLNGQIDDLQHRVDSTLSEEEPIKIELQQAQADLVEAQTAEAGLDPKYYLQLHSIPESSIITRLPVSAHGRFSWPHMEHDNVFAEGEKSHSYWLFSCAVRPDGRRYWSLTHFSIEENTIVPILIPPESFVSTKAILRPDLPPDEQQ